MATWVIVSVYGPADHARSAYFLGEITTLVGAKRAANLPVVVGGDFNLIRSGADKNNGNIDWARVSLFNNAIAAAALREIARTGARYTWTNKQRVPVRCVLDRVFCSSDWEALFPLCTLVAETRIGSDHVPLILSSGEDSGVPKRTSRVLVLRGCGFAGFPRGWGANHGSESKRERERIVEEIASIDAQADVRPFSGDEWEHRYSLENQVLAILRAEEEYWRHRGGVKWVVKGDANTGYFHAYANGRPIALTEIIHELKRTRGQGVILKLDFEKAYDRVN
ncbi:uncharacterized protein [Aegilops tauschii subsp. strangulata]|uniref:uncharacterized protein n=1 Tax=Aegilops tauschii subsp. strangulata TaxID=200361 RepID=UPI003CC872B0